MNPISQETSRPNQVKEKPRYQNVLGNGLERSQRPPIKGEKGRGRVRRLPSTTRSISPSHITYPQNVWIYQHRSNTFSKCLSVKWLPIWAWSFYLSSTLSGSDIAIARNLDLNVSGPPLWRCWELWFDPSKPLSYHKRSVSPFVSSSITGGLELSYLAEIAGGTLREQECG
jgi:hypothetical protein